jgi:hypothetical protein
MSQSEQSGSQVACLVSQQMHDGTISIVWIIKSVHCL